MSIKYILIKGVKGVGLVVYVLLLSYLSANFLYWLTIIITNYITGC